MCGIAGIVGPSANQAIGAMVESLAHRGPDDRGIFHRDPVALGQSRLSIIDIGGGHQPISNEDGTVHLVCNGEIYNSPGLRTELEVGGHRFRTRTDVEVILHLYEELGARCVERLRGMFAFAIWDEPRRRLLLARDHLGQKPLFYARTAEGFAFASEVKAVLASGLAPVEPDLSGLWHYLSLRYLPDHYTLFQGIQKLPAAHSLVLEDGRIETRRYWEVRFTEKHRGGEAAITRELHQLLRDTVEDNLLSDVRVGAFLSGGIDSGTVASIIATLRDEPIPRFSIGTGEKEFNELPFARQVAEKYGMESHEEVVEPDLVGILPAMVRAMDEPADPFGFGVYLVARLASRHVKVVLGGDGGDENFGGYDRYLGQRMLDFYGYLPAWLRREVLEKVAGWIPENYGYKSFAQKAAWVREMSSFSGGERYARSLGVLRFTDEAKTELFTPAARATIEDAESTRKVLAFFEADNATDLVDRMLYTDLMTRIPDHLLVIADRMTMAHSLESRSPLIDYRLVEFAARIPGNLKVRGRRLKYILRKVAEEYLPPEITRLKKQGFRFPLGIWFRGKLRPLLEQVFAESRFVERGIFEKASIDRYLEEHWSGKIDHNYRIWVLLNLEIWYRLYFEGRSVADLTEELTKTPFAL